MADHNKRKRDETGEEVRSGLGAFSGDTMLSALDPFGTAAVTSSDRAVNNKVGDYDDKHSSKTRDAK